MFLEKVFECLIVIEAYSLIVFVNSDCGDEANLFLLDIQCIIIFWVKHELKHFPRIVILSKTPNLDQALST